MMRLEAPRSLITDCTLRLDRQSPWRKIYVLFPTFGWRSGVRDNLDFQSKALGCLGLTSVPLGTNIGMKYRIMQAYTVFLQDLCRKLIQGLIFPSLKSAEQLPLASVVQKQVRCEQNRGEWAKAWVISASFIDAAGCHTVSGVGNHIFNIESLSTYLDTFTNIYAT